ncbi:MAG: GH13_3 / GH13 / GH13_38 [uncultured Acetobacteraceae bacterium]|uniref:Alpha-1,4-glucan:maltose-1-phosphate maltosyltransferase n=1 Tax=uncultured Acetobacteraceae bacterium TaxID=169975 RepID=A0A6J4HMX6_9PROT|nr:MAG: GH13_3 / GH13 / GH13_38 [uncultured Acetobacteraceae bacterium]
MVLKRGRKPKTIAHAELDAPKPPPAPDTQPVPAEAAPPVAAPVLQAVRNATLAASDAPSAASDARPAAGCPRLYYLHPAMIGPLPAWDAAFAHAAGLGFDGVLLAPVGTPGESGHLFQIGDPDRPHPALEAEGDTAAALSVLAGKAREAGVALHLDLVLDRAASDGRLVAEHPEWFAAPPADAPPDPRQAPAEQGIRPARMFDDGVAEALADWWEARLRAYAAAGVAGFRCDAPARVPVAMWRRFTAGLPDCRFMAWTAGLAARDLQMLGSAGFAATFNSLAWWDGREGWLAEEAFRLSAVAPAIATVEIPFGPRLATGEEDAALAERSARQRLRFAAGTGAGLLMPMGFEFGAHRPLDPARARPEDWQQLRARPPVDVSEEVRAANARLAAEPARAVELRPLSGPGAPVTALLRADEADVRRAKGARLVLGNPDGQRAASVRMEHLLAGAAGFARFRPALPETGEALTPGSEVRLEPGEVRLLEAEPPRPVVKRPPEAPVRRRAEDEPGEDAVALAARAPRIGIEAVEPAVDGGRFAVKRTVGETVEVSADLICDGHDKLGAALLWRAADEAEWQETRLEPLGNDRWAASFPLLRMGRYAFAVEAWRDAFATFLDEITKKHAAGVPIALELEEGRLLVAAAAERAGGELSALASRLKDAAEAERLAALTAPGTAALMAAADDRPFRARSAEMPVEAERIGARFASWYELFPRSQSGDPSRHGTFRDVIARLPRIRAMGFDVLYFPPIHPIGRAFRKGKNNSLTPGPDEPGSPYAIGSPEGGHDAVHPELGTLDDFLALRDAAAAQGLELALDFAVQCSPDHPWLREHKDWFDWRPDGSLRYAENPPKKYQDIVNVDFYAKGAVPSLWLALRDVVRFWCEQGVRLFRVDNPHTKPLPFWEWMIADIRGQYPDAVFLAEAFTRPKVMNRLAKIGFSQSYTYFTWRNHKAEIIEYLTQLTTEPPRDFFRPHFFVNTPDINPYYLQTSGRAGFLVRAALATTLSGLWGMYQGFEYCEGRALPGREEYLDSEKYEIRAWPDRADGDIVDEIARLNAIRKANPALQTHMGLAFHNAFNDQVLWYRKSTPDRSNVLLCAVSLDPHGRQEATVELPLWEWGLPDSGALEAEDLLRGHRFTWRGKTQRVGLDPYGLPFGIWRVRPAEGA